MHPVHAHSPLSPSRISANPRLIQQQQAPQQRPAMPPKAAHPVLLLLVLQEVGAPQHELGLDCIVHLEEGWRGGHQGDGSKAGSDWDVATGGRSRQWLATAGTQRQRAAAQPNTRHAREISPTSSTTTMLCSEAQITPLSKVCSAAGRGAWVEKWCSSTGRSGRQRTCAQLRHSTTPR